MSRKALQKNFDQTLETLRSQGFEVAAQASAAGSGALVSKYGVGAVLTAVPGAPAAFVQYPGVLVRGEIARLLDRGYQKFIKTSQYELPATAAQLHAIHAFSEELKRLIGDVNLYNEALGTTSDVYEYDRLKGREPEQAAAASPWSTGGGH